jgi:hypothetical protein
MGSLVNETNDIKEEISKRIQNANTCYYGLLKHFKSHFLTRETNCRLYTTLVRPVLTYTNTIRHSSPEQLLKGKY